MFSSTKIGLCSNTHLTKIDRQRHPCAAYRDKAKQLYAELNLELISTSGEEDHLFGTPPTSWDLNSN